jgi:hypothetical protein
MSFLDLNIGAVFSISNLLFLFLIIGAKKIPFSQVSFGITINSVCSTTQSISLSYQVVLDDFLIP